MDGYITPILLILAITEIGLIVEMTRLRLCLKKATPHFKSIHSFIEQIKNKLSDFTATAEEVAESGATINSEKFGKFELKMKDKKCHQ